VALRYFDDAVVVAGAGAAGMAAAIAAAREGARVFILEQAAKPGGTVTHSLLHTLAGFYDVEGRLMNGGLPAELIARLADTRREAKPRRIGRLWTLAVSPEFYGQVTERWLAEEPGIALASAARIRHVEVCKSRVVELSADTAHGHIIGEPRAVVDATGSAEIVRMIDPLLVEDDSEPSAGGLMTRLRGVAVGGALAGVKCKRIIDRAVADGRLPAQCAHAWLDQGVRDDEVYVKQLVPIPPRRPDHTPYPWPDIPKDALEERRLLIGFLTTVDGFREARIDGTGLVGARDAGRVVGEYVLTADDLRRGRKFSDAVCRASWPIEHWDARYGVTLEYLTDGDHYEIPLRSLKVRKTRNLWTAGKCLSADRLAQASARVVGLCWAMGEAAGKTAARHESA
jgi:FAD dependent oxidoreductase